MAEYSTPEQRTEMPTQRRLEHLSKEGALYQSHEVAQLMALISGFLVLSYTWQWLLSDILIVYKKSFELISNSEPITPRILWNGFVSLIILLGPPLIITIGTVAVVAYCSVGLQTQWNRRKPIIKFRWDMLNPINGISRIFSLHGFVNVLKSIAKLSLILPIAYFALKSQAHQMVSLVHLSVPEVMSFTGTVMVKLFWRICYVLVPLAIFDFVWGKFQWLKKNKMTKQEVTDERKSVEGDETVKRKIQAKGIQRLMQRIKNSVPKADVVITNPTHYAIALKYDRKTMSAPIVVAKGKGHMALRIREIAKESGVPIVERKPLARALYASVEVGAQIPYELFKAVAEVLAYVYRIKNPYRASAATQAGR